MTGEAGCSWPSGYFSDFYRLADGYTSEVNTLALVNYLSTS